MMNNNIPMSKIRQRINGLNGSNNIRLRSNPISIYESLEENGYDFNKVIDIVYNWDRLANNKDLAADRIFELYDIVEENGSVAQINSLTKMIVEIVLPQLKNQKNIKNKAANKLSNVDKLKDNFKKNTKDVKNVFDNITGGMKDNFKKNTNQIKSNIKKSINYDDKKAKEKKKAVKEGLNTIINTSNDYINCDRLLSNYSSLSKRFNINNIVDPYKSIHETVEDFCTMIETYDSPFKLKYNTTLETLLYLFDKNISSPYNQDEIVTEVTEYFLNTDNFVVEDMKFILNNNRFLPKEAITESLSILCVDDNPLFFNEVDAEPYEISKLRTELNRAKIVKDKDPGLLKKVLQTAITDSPKNIVDGTPNLLTWTRVVFIAGVFAINPIIGAISWFVSMIKGTEFRIKELERLIKAYQKEKESAEKDMNRVKNEEKKERYEKYIKELDKAIEMLSNQKDNIELTEKEKDEKNSADFGDDDDFSFDEEFSGNIPAKTLGEDNIKNIVYVQTVSNQLDKFVTLYESNKLLDNIKNNFDNISNKDIMLLAEFSAILPEFLDRNEYKKILDEKSKEIRESTMYNNIKNFIRVDSINEAFFDIDNINEKMFEKYVINEDNIDDYIKLIECAYEVTTPILELSVTNSFKLAVEKVKKGVQNLTTKEKEACKTIDAYANSFMRAAEQALTNDNRESVIRGSLIPSFSKMIKGSILLGGAMIVNPIVGAIAAIAAIGASKKLQQRERALIIDEIQTELKLTEKQIRIAEDNNDMKALRKLYQIERSLKRTEQRIMYNTWAKGKDIPKINDER